MLEKFSLKGKIAVVVGGSGLYGRQVTAALEEAGAITYITTRKKEKTSKIQAEFYEKGVNVIVDYLDQSKETTIIDFAEKIVKKHGKIDILVNNAVGRPMSGWNDKTENFSKSMEINATGIYSLTKIFGNIMDKQKHGSIIQIGSIQGMVGPDDWLYEGKFDVSPDYFFHKAGMINFTKFVASYYGKSNVRCNCISPGGIKSYRTPEEFVDRYNKKTMLNRMANKDDLKGIVVFLASDASSYITAANIPVDGGYTAK